MSEPFLGEIRIFGFNFAPQGWALCNGQLLPIAQNTALFSLLGTTYGGNGQTTFALPNLQSRVPLHQGQGPGLSQYYIGQSAGSETVTLTSNEMPIHNHQVGAASAPTSKSPSGAVPAYTSTGSSYGTTARPADERGHGGHRPAGRNRTTTCSRTWWSTSASHWQGIYPSRNRWRSSADAGRSFCALRGLRTTRSSRCLFRDARPYLAATAAAR